MFQSTPSHGGRLLFHDFIIHKDTVSIHALTWRATLRWQIFQIPVLVSIHALTWRATALISVSSVSASFQSTPSHGGRHLCRLCTGKGRCVSIHALTWRATLVNKTYSLTNYYNIQNANIHKILLNKKYGTLFLVPTI